MKVYIATQGESSEGGTPIAVDFHKSRVVDFVQALPPSPNSGGTEWIRDAEDSWVCGCDVIMITEHSTLTP